MDNIIQSLTNLFTPESEIVQKQMDGLEKTFHGQVVQDFIDPEFIPKFNVQEVPPNRLASSINFLDPERNVR